MAEKFNKISSQKIIRAVSVVISFGILVLIYFKIDLKSLANIFKDCNIPWLIISLLMFIPTTLMTCIRFKQLLPPKVKTRFSDIIGLILSASTMNMFLPSKMGDIVKSYFMKNNFGINGPFSLTVVIFEKTCDLLSLLVLCLAGLLTHPVNPRLFWVFTGIILFGLIFGFIILSSRIFAKLFFTLLYNIVPKKFKKNIGNFSDSWYEVQDFFFKNKIKLFAIAVNSIFIWFLHLLQFWFFIFALKSYVPFFKNLALSSLSILAGLLPLTFAGIGTRDAAIIYFYTPFFNSEVGAAIGILATSRYLIPAIIGIPFFGKYLSGIKINKKK